MAKEKQTVCEDCVDKITTTGVGYCTYCGQFTSSDSIECCPSCAKEKGICECCEKELE